jgi:hypothetical protein
MSFQKISARFTVCGQEGGNLEHRFLKCPINKQTWVTLYRILPLLQNFNLTQLMDLDFELPPNLQRGAKILLSEGLYTLWTARNEVTFERRQHDNHTVHDLFMRRIKVRLKTEWTIQGPTQLAELWQHNWWWQQQGVNIVFLF